MFVITQQMVQAIGIGYLVFCLCACALVGVAIYVARRGPDVEDTLDVDTVVAMGEEAAWWREAQEVDVEAWSHLRSHQPSHQHTGATIIPWPARRADLPPQEQAQ